MITYKYAKNINGQKTDIAELNHLNKDEKYTCIGCEEEMIPCMGEVKRHYFRHKLVGECNGETYLHLLGKMTFKEVYENCLNNGDPFILKYEVEEVCIDGRDKFGFACSLGERVIEVDLTKQYSEIKLEKRDGEFIPDIQLINGKGKIIYIEIAVTHKSEVKKQRSGKKIIEFLIGSESDIKHIESKLIYWRDDWINTYGINTESIEVEECHGCTEKVVVFVVNNSGKYFSKKLSSYALNMELKRLQNKYAIAYYSCIRKKNWNGSAFKKELISVYNQGINIKNCYLCQHHALTKTDRGGLAEPMICKYLKKMIISKCALDCDYFRPIGKGLKKYERGQNSEKEVVQS